MAATFTELLPTQASSLSGHRPEIDGLRALAVIPVILFHLGVRGVSGGFVGVDIFFVISGYLISSIIFDGLARGTFTITGFYERRVRRIFPALYAVIGFCILASIALLLPIQLQLFGGSAAAISLFSSNFLFLRQSGYFDAVSSQKPLLHTWSLAVEEQFYLFFPLLLLLLRRRRQRTVAAVLAVMGVLSLIFSIWFARAFPAAAFYLLAPRAWELLLGGVLAIGVKRKQPDGRISNVAAWAGALLILFSIFVYSRDTAFPGEAALAPCSGAGLIIFAGIGSRVNRGSPVVLRLLSLPAVVFVGLISYSLYLWHWPLMVFSTWYLDRNLNGFEQGLVFAATFGMAVLSYYFVEIPFRASSKRFSRRFMFRAAAAAICSVMLIGLALRQTKGLPQRMDAGTVKLAAGTWDWDHTQDRCFGMEVETLATSGPCVLGKAGAAPSFLVWGDSHAKMLFTVVGQQAALRGEAGMTAAEPDCPAMLGVWRNDRVNPRHCRAFNDVMESYAARHPEIKTVMLVSRWALYAEGTRVGSDAGTSVYLADVESREKSYAENFRVFQRGMERTVRRLQAVRKQVVIFADVPEVSSLPPESLAKARWFHRTSDIRPKVADYIAREKPVEDVFRGLEQRHQVGVIYPSDLLCGTRYCAVEADGRSLYLDADHLSQAGTSKIAPVLGKLFR